MEYNVILLVLDTLREDYSLDLNQLCDLGFRKYENAIATASWTLPSHASIFTGLMPSAHSVHEAKDFHGKSKNLRQLAIQKLGQNGGIISELRHSGYTTHELTCNPFVSPMFGFQFSDYKIFGRRGLVKESRKSIKARNNFRSELLKHERTRSMGRPILRRCKTVIDFIDRKMLEEIYQKLNYREKGSSHCIASLRNLKFVEPFFFFANLMDAHQPYAWNDPSSDLIGEIIYTTITGTKLKRRLDWLRKYPKYANIAISHLLEMVKILKPYLDNSLVIVLSDHGQLLGEGGRYDHGFFLDDELLRVPFFVRFPSGFEPLRQKAKYVSLTSVPTIIDDVLCRSDTPVGSDVALAESFGPTSNMERFCRTQEDRDRVQRTYAHRVKVYMKNGSAVYNKSNDTFEEIKGGISKEEAKSLAESLRPFKETQLGRSLSGIREDKNPAESVFDAGEEAKLGEQLKSLGYF